MSVLNWELYYPCDYIKLFLLPESSGSAVFSLKKILALVMAPGAGFLLFIRMLAGKIIIAMENYKLKYEINGVVDM